MCVAACVSARVVCVRGVHGAQLCLNQWNDACTPRVTVYLMLSLCILPYTSLVGESPLHSPSRVASAHSTDKCAIFTALWRIHFLGTWRNTSVCDAQSTAQHEHSWRHTSGGTCTLLWEQALGIITVHIYNTTPEHTGHHRWSPM